MISKYKKIWLFLAKFFAMYIVLTLMYQYYLSLYHAGYQSNKIDYLTQRLSQHVANAGKVFGFNVRVTPNTDEPSMRLIFEGKYVARIVEGCNAVAVMILFISFVFAFSGKMINMITFGLLGVILLYMLNLMRILSLGWALFHYPQYASFLHQIAFPLVIYGFTFLLWIFWVKHIENQIIKTEKL